MVLQKESVDQGFWPLHSPSNTIGGKAYIYNFQKMEVGLDKPQLITNEVEEWSRKREERELEDSSGYMR
jgi:hypothetical protein